MLGALWFSPILFGKIWADGLGFNLDDKSLTIKKIIGSIVTAFLATISLALILDFIGTYDVLTSLLVLTYWNQFYLYCRFVRCFI